MKDVTDTAIIACALPFKSEKVQGEKTPPKTVLGAKVSEISAEGNDEFTLNH